MRDARDAEDARLLSSGDHETLLATYLDAILGRCFAAIRSPEADDVAQNVIERLWRELQSGRTYDVPFRVVVHNVVTWTIKGHFARRRGEAPLEEVDDVDPIDPYAEWEGVHDLETLIAGLPPRQAQVARLRFLEGLEIAEIAAELGMERNAVDQALHNARAKLREAHG
jgi:RNA polymerase sigma-70 factor (ECF subfamily)